jgi:Tol biopolymer transport system component
MTAYDRFEHDLPELMSELAAARVPDYLDDMLRQSARTRQRPRWSALERWIPMGVIARTAPMRQIPWRPIAVAALLVVSLAAAVGIWQGSQHHVSPPPPFGPANNGNVLITQRGDLLIVDPATGVTHDLVTGRDQDDGPLYAPDGRTFTFGRATGDRGVWVANADGTDAHRVFDGTGYEFDWADWSQSGDRIIAVGQEPAAGSVIAVIDPVAKTSVIVHSSRWYGAAVMPYGRDQLVLAGETDDGGNSFFLMDLNDPEHARQLPVSPFAINQPALSPDGSQLVYSTWDDGLGTGGNLHVLDLDTAVDRLITPSGNATYLWQSPQFMPDGTSILANRWNADGTFQLTIVPADGSPDRGIGPVHTQDGGGTSSYISPDGRTVFAAYHDDGANTGEFWRIDVASGQGTLLPMPEPDALSWQRVGQ